MLEGIDHFSKQSTILTEKEMLSLNRLLIQDWNLYFTVQEGSVESLQYIHWMEQYTAIERWQGVDMLTFQVSAEAWGF